MQVLFFNELQLRCQTETSRSRSFSLLRNKMECMMNFSPYCLREDVTRNIGSQITKVKVHLDNQCDQINGRTFSSTSTPFLFFDVFFRKSKQVGLTLNAIVCRKSQLVVSQ